MATGIGKRRAAQAKKSSHQYSARRKQIVDAAAQVFRDQGFEAVTLGDVALRLNTDRASLYYYFASKEELYREVVSGVSEENVRVIEDIAQRDIPTPEKLRLSIVSLMEAYDRFYPYMHVFVQTDLTKQAGDDAWSRDIVDWSQRYYNAMRSIVEQGVREGTFRDLPVGIATMSVIGCVNWAHRWYEPDGRLDASAIGQVFVSVLLEGLKPPRKRPVSAAPARRPRRKPAKG